MMMIGFGPSYRIYEYAKDFAGMFMFADGIWEEQMQSIPKYENRFVNISFIAFVFTFATISFGCELNEYEGELELSCQGHEVYMNGRAITDPISGAVLDSDCLSYRGCHVFPGFYPYGCSGDFNYETVKVLNRRTTCALLCGDKQIDCGCDGVEEEHIASFPSPCRDYCNQKDETCGSLSGFEMGNCLDQCKVKLEGWCGDEYTQFLACLRTHGGECSDSVSVDGECITEMVANLMCEEEGYLWLCKWGLSDCSCITADRSMVIDNHGCDYYDDTWECCYASWDIPGRWAQCECFSDPTVCENLGYGLEVESCPL